MDGQKIILFMICVNVVMYLFGFQLVQGDILSKLMDTSGLTTTGQSTSIKFNSNVTNAFPEDVYQTSGGGITEVFTDGLTMIWAVVKLIFNLLTSPVAIFVTFLHPVIAILIGVPFALIYLLAIIKFVRGADF